MAVAIELSSVRHYSIPASLPHRYRHGDREGYRAGMLPHWYAIKKSEERRSWRYFSIAWPGNEQSRLRSKTHIHNHRDLALHTHLRRGVNISYFLPVSPLCSAGMSPEDVKRSRKKYSPLFLCPFLFSACLNHDCSCISQFRQVICPSLVFRPLALSFYLSISLKSTHYRTVPTQPIPLPHTHSHIHTPSPGS